MNCKLTDFEESINLLGEDIDKIARETGLDQLAQPWDWFATELAYRLAKAGWVKRV